MLLVVSPYHLTTREAPAMAALLVADRVATLLPEPGGSDRKSTAERSAQRVPRYLSFLKSWQWTMPLWEAGVLDSSVDGDDPAGDVADVCRRITIEEQYGVLRPLMRPDLFEDEDRYLDSIAGDLLKGGPDPALSVPVAAALDRFAIRHGAAVARSEATSVAQRAEAHLGQKLFAFAAPVLVQAGGKRLAEARELLAEPLASLRAGLEELIAEDPPAGGLERLRGAAREYAEAFERERTTLTLPPDDDDGDERVIAGSVAVTAVRLPVDAVLSSSVTACRAVLGSARSGSAAGAPGLVTRDPLAGRSVKSLVVKVMGRSA